ncbi:MAG: hypothetical protein HY286_01130 [Planctomycetes bacterium]|nr:hypothetical protein [Planctomycetota bacterium]
MSTLTRFLRYAVVGSILLGSVSCVCVDRYGYRGYVAVGACAPCAPTYAVVHETVCAQVCAPAPVVVVERVHVVPRYRRHY